MKKVFLLMGFLAFSLMSISQNTKRNSISQFEKAYYFETSKSFTYFDILIKNIVDLDGGVKFALKITNTSSSFLIYNPEQSKVVINGNELPVEGKTKIIDPSNTKSQTIRVNRGNTKRQETFNFLLGNLTLLKEDNSPIEVDDFEIPMTRKDFKFDNVSCSVSIPVRKTQKMTVKITMKNNGDKYIIVHPGRIGLEMPDDKTYTSKNASDVIILAPHSEESVSLKWDRMPKGSLNDMQKVDMGVDFTEVFFYATPEETASESIEIKWDKTLTIEKQ